MYILYISYTHPFLVMSCSGNDMQKISQEYKFFNNLYKWYYQTFWLNIILVDGQIYTHNLKDLEERDLPYQLIN